MSLDLGAEPTAAETPPRTVWVRTASGVMETTVPRLPAAPGPPGPQGDPGPAGGAVLAAFWQYSNTTAAPPANGQVRFDANRSTMWVAELDTDGMNRTEGLSKVTAGSTILVRAANGSWSDLRVLATPVDSGSYWTMLISVLSGTVTPGSRTQLNFVVTPPYAIPPGGTTGQVLKKLSGADYDVGWVNP